MEKIVVLLVFGSVFVCIFTFTALLQRALGGRQIGTLVTDLLDGSTDRNSGVTAHGGSASASGTRETARLERRVGSLEERVEVLERIVTSPGHDLSEEIRRLG